MSVLRRDSFDRLHWVQWQVGYAGGDEEGAGKEALCGGNGDKDPEEKIE